MPYKNPEDRRRNARKYRKENHEKVRANERKAETKYYLKNKPKQMAKKGRWRAKNMAKERAIVRRHLAKKNGYAECTEYPPPPTDKKCAICHRETKSLVLDHDHETGTFRGYLCRSCNSGLGMLGDTMEAVQLVLKYLEHNNV